MTSLSHSILTAAVLLALTTYLPARDIFVDGNHAKADDKNPGTLAAPLKTIQAALDKAQPGDSVQLRAGVYYGGVRFRRGGSHYWGAVFDPGTAANVQWLTLQAYNDEHVVLDGAETVPAGKWQRAPGRENTYWAPFATTPYDDRVVNMVFCGNRLLTPTLRRMPGANSSKIEGTPSDIMPAMPGDGPADEGWFFDRKQKQLFVNLRGRVPGRDLQCRAAKWIDGVDAQNESYVRIRKLELRNFVQSAIVVCRGHEFIVEDNYVHHCGHALWGSPTSGGIIRRNTMTDLMGVSMSIGGARGTVVEENVIQRSNINPYKIVAWDGSAIICNGAFGLALRNNVICDSTDISGVWPDCSAAGIVLYGNTIYNMGSGFYIEAGAVGTVLRWNTVFDTGSAIGFRDNFANVAFENYLFRNRGGLGVGTCEEDDRPMGNVMFHNWVIDNGAGSGFSPDRLKQPAHVFDHNVYKFQDKGQPAIFRYGDKQYRDLKTLRAEVGQEVHGKVVARFDPTPLGLATFRVHGTKKSWEPVPMFSNPTIERPDLLVASGEPYFWKKGSFRGPEDYGWYGVNTGFLSQTRGDGSGFVRLYWTRGGYWDKGPFDDRTASRAATYTRGVASASPEEDHLASLQVGANPTPDKIISAEGYGYWSPSLPTTDGAEIDLSLWIRAKKVKAAAPGGGVFVTVEFCDETGQHVTRQYLVGGDGSQEPVAAEWATGDYLFRRLTGTATAPSGARRFKLGFGLKSCSGWAAFSDIDIKTRPGKPEVHDQSALTSISRRP
jgi:hypothetical protein